MKHSLSVIIPTFNAASSLKQCLSALTQKFHNTQIIVADGGSQDQTLSIAESFRVQIVKSRRGRGSQCNAGAAVANGEFLLFLHADTFLPSEAQSILERFLSLPQFEIGTFWLKFDYNHWLMNFYAYFTRFDSLWTRFGDQGIVVRKEFFDSMGGFPDWPLMEDIHFLRLARKKTKIHSFPAYVTTSSVRFRQNGILRQQIFNILLIIRYLFGQSPHELAQRYQEKMR